MLYGVIDGTMLSTNGLPDRPSAQGGSNEAISLTPALYFEHRRARASRGPRRPRCQPVCPRPDPQTDHCPRSAAHPPAGRQARMIPRTFRQAGPAPSWRGGAGQTECVTVDVVSTIAATQLAAVSNSRLDFPMHGRKGYEMN